MLVVTEVPGTPIVEFDYDDGLDEAAVRSARETVERVARREGRVRLLGIVGRIGRITAGGWREDLKTVGGVGRIERVALVTDSRWMGPLAKAEAKVLGFELRAFRRSGLAEARAWLRSP